MSEKIKKLFSGVVFLGILSFWVVVFGAQTQAQSAPVAQFSADVASGGVHLVAQFTDSSTGSPTSWAWDFDNNGSTDSTEQNPEYTFSSAGTYTVKLTVSNAYGSDSEIKSEYIIVLNQPSRSMDFWRASGEDWGTEYIVGNISREDEVIEDLLDFHIKRVVSSFGDWTDGAGNPEKTSTEKDQIGAWNEKLHNNGIDCEVFLADYDSIIPGSPERQKLLDDVVEIIDFNDTRLDDSEKLDAINLDLEPQSLAAWDAGDGDLKKQYLNYLLDTYQTVRSTMDSNGATDMELNVQLAHFFDKLPGDGGQVNWSSEAERDTWFSDVNDEINKATIMDYELGTLSSILSTTSYERGVFDVTEIDLNVRDVDPYGSTWSNLNELMDMLVQVETTLDNPTGLHSYRYLKALISTPSAPVGAFISHVTSGTGPLTVQFQDLSYNSPTSWAWDFDNNGTTDSTEQNPRHTFLIPGAHDVKLTVTNSTGSDEEIEYNYIYVYGISLYEDLVAHYKFNGDLLDETNNDLDLTHYTYSGSEVESDVNFSSDSLSGQSVYFDGDTSQNGLRGDDLETYLADGFTYTAWVKIPESVIVDGSKRGVIGQALAPYLIKNASGNLEARVDFTKPDTSEYQVLVTSSGLLPGDDWTHVALTWYPTTSDTEMNVVLYIDGVSVAEDNSPYTDLNYDYSLAIGKISASLYFFDGFIDEVKIFSTSLTASEILQEYQSDQNPPVAQFSANQTSGDVPMTVQFSDLSTGSNTNWYWDFDNDGTIDSTEQNPSHTFSSAGTYSVSLTVSDGRNGDEEVKVNYITVSEAADESDENELSIDIKKIKDITTNSLKIKVDVDEYQDNDLDFKVRVENLETKVKYTLKFHEKVDVYGEATLNVRGLRPDTRYKFKVKVSEEGESDYSDYSDSKKATTLKEEIKESIITPFEPTITIDEEEKSLETKTEPEIKQLLDEEIKKDDKELFEVKEDRIIEKEKSFWLSWWFLGGIGLLFALILVLFFIFRR